MGGVGRGLAQPGVLHEGTTAASADAAIINQNNMEVKDALAQSAL
jgi:hypothetical protein